MSANSVTGSIRIAAREIIRAHPKGIRYTALKDEVLKRLPNANPASVGRELPKLPGAFPDEISKPERGLFVSVGLREPAAPARRESDFYAPFAEWLRNDLEEATEAVVVGGAFAKVKWGTPDVVGVLRPARGDAVQFEPEIIAAEIKKDPLQSVLAFGQAMAYRLFAAKSYVVMPDTVSADELPRLESLCLLSGVGCVLFSARQPQPEFEIRVRASRHVPDMYYVNDFAARLRDFDPKKFQFLFG